MVMQKMVMSEVTLYVYDPIFTHDHLYRYRTFIYVTPPFNSGRVLSCDQSWSKLLMPLMALYKMYSRSFLSLPHTIVVMSIWSFTLVMFIEHMEMWLHG